MTSGPYAGEQDKIDRSINSFATQSFRDQADRDYIAARLACRYELFSQFLWASHQAIEKYLKGILLYNRVKAKSVRHDLLQALSMTRDLSFEIDLSPRSREFIEHIAKVGEFRYVDVPFYVHGHLLVDLDLTIWELRRYCQVLNVFGKTIPWQEQALLVEAKSNLVRSKTEPRYKFRLHDGLLEKILGSRRHPSRPALLWQNSCYGVRKRAHVRVKNHLNAMNPHLYLYPEMLDELIKYVYIPPRLVRAYQDHLANKKLGLGVDK